MNQELDNRPIEILGLSKDTVIKLKNIFVYTVGDLQGKTEKSLQMCIGLENYLIAEIVNALVSKTQRGLSITIENDDQIENLKLHITTKRCLLKIGICRISELMRLSKLEICTIRGVNEKGLSDIEEALREYYGERYNSEKENIMKQSTDAIGLGHLNIVAGVFQTYRKGGVYTIGDFQRKLNQELLEIPLIGKGTNDKVTQELSKYGIQRYKTEENRVGKFDFPTHIANALNTNGVYTVCELGEQTLVAIIDNPRIRDASLDEILEKYLIDELLKEQEVGEKVTELQLLEKIKSIMMDIKKDTQWKKRKLKEILEEVKNQIESGRE